MFSRELHAENDASRRTLHQLVQRLQDLVAEAVREGQAQGTLRAGVAPTDAAFLIISVFQGVTLRWSISGRSFNLAREGDRMVELVLAGLARERA